MRVSGNLDEQVAAGKIFASEAVFFGAEDQSHAAAALDLGDQARRQIGEGDDGLLGLAMGEGTGADYQGAIGYRAGKCRGHFCVLEEV